MRSKTRWPQLKEIILIRFYMVYKKFLYFSYLIFLKQQ